MGANVLVISADHELVQLLEFLLDRSGLVAVPVADREDALDALERHALALALVDLDSGAGDAFTLISELRTRKQALAIIALAASADDATTVRAIDLGADDVVQTPSAFRAFAARIRVHMRRAGAQRANGAPVIAAGPLRLNTLERTIHLDGQAVRLSGAEARLLEELMLNVDEVVTADALASKVAGFDDQAGREVVRVTLHRLRRKLGDESRPRRFIHTIPGVGLKLRVDDGGPNRTDA